MTNDRSYADFVWRMSVWCVGQRTQWWVSYVARWRKLLRISMTTCHTTRHGWRWFGITFSVPISVRMPVWSVVQVQTQQPSWTKPKMRNRNNITSAIMYLPCHFFAQGLQPVMCAEDTFCLWHIFCCFLHIVCHVVLRIGSYRNRCGSFCVQIMMCWLFYCQESGLRCMKHYVCLLGHFLLECC